MNILFQRSFRGSKVSGVLLLACEDGDIYAKGSIKLDASRAIRSKEGYEEAYKDTCEEGCEEACKDTYEDNYKSIRGLFGLPFTIRGNWSFTSITSGKSFIQKRPKDVSKG